MRSLRSLASLLLALALGASSTATLAAPPKKKPVAARSKSDAGKGGKADAGKGAKADAGKGGKGDAGKVAKPKASSNKTQSIGAPNAGRLQGASRLKGSKQLKQREGAHSWALPQMVNLLGRASTTVAQKHKGASMLVGDLSGRTGGPLDGHGSHQTGRDADVAFYATNSKGKPLPIQHFVAFDGTGKARIVPGTFFDDTRNWALVEALLKDQKANVRYLFISTPLKGRLLAYAMRNNVDKDFIVRASTVMMSPPDADVHDDHFHVRIACPESMKDVCLEEAMIRACGGAGSGDAAWSANLKSAGDGGAAAGDKPAVDAPKPAGDAAAAPAPKPAGDASN
ncbi:MAG: penicillin-insensitive murein endopeptidase [Minicystis sp.]